MSNYRDADSWLQEVREHTTTQEGTDTVAFTEDSEPPEGLIHAKLADGTDMPFVMAQRLRWAVKGSDDDISEYRYLTADELDFFIENAREPAELAAKLSKFIQEIYPELVQQEEKLDKLGMSSASVSLVAHFSLNCSNSESGTLANVTNNDMRRLASELLARSMGAA